MLSKIFLCTILLVNYVKSLSVCDDIDIIFLVDKDSIINNMDNVLWFIQSIIEDGSSEYSAFSTYVYGEDINYADELKLVEISLLDTFDTHRANKSSIVTTRLKSVFTDIITTTAYSTDINVKSTSISLDDVFKIASQQEQPVRMHKKRNKFNTRKYKTHDIGAADDENRYFIFDYHNKLLTNENSLTNDVCSIFKYIDTKTDESIHFIFGQAPHSDDLIDDILNSLCEEEYSPIVHEDLFFYLSTDDYYQEMTDENGNNYQYESFLYNLLNGEETLESAYHITCPAHHKHPQFDGSLHLTAHNQWIDPDTFIECHLKYMKHPQYDDNTFSNVLLNPYKSYIYVHDHLHDDNTFKLDDHLMADPETFDEIKKMGCLEPIYKITDIQHIETVTEKLRILKLFVTTPSSPMDYLLSADIGAKQMEFQKYTKNVNVKVFDEDNDEDESKDTHINNGRRRLPSFKSIFGKSKYKELVDLSGDEEQEVDKVGDNTDKDGVLIQKTFPALITGKTEFDTSKSFAVGPFTATANAAGFMEVKGFIIQVDFKADWKFKWSKLITARKASAAIKFDISGWWSVTSKFDFELAGTFKIEGPLIPEFGQTVVIPIGPVPLVLKPYFKAGFSIETEKLMLQFSVECTYKEKITLGYDYQGRRSSSKSRFHQITKGYFLRRTRSIAITGGIRDYMKMDSKASSEEAEVDGPPGHWIWKREQDVGASKCETSMTLSNGDKGTECDLKFGFNILIKPEIGVTMYGAINVNGKINIKIPVGYKVKIDDDGAGTCENKKSEVCPPRPPTKGTPTKKIMAGPYLKVLVQAEVEFKLYLPNVIAGLKEFYAVYKIKSRLKKQYIMLQTKLRTWKGEVKEAMQKLIGYYRELVVDNKGVKATFEALKKLNDDLVGWKNQYASIKEQIEVNYKMCEKHIAKIKKLIKTVKSIIADPFAKKTVGKSFTYPKEFKQIWEKTFGASKCKEITATKAVALFLDESKNGCCKGFTYDAHSIFSDWYQGYDAYIDGENKDRYHDRYGNRQKAFNSAPVIYAPQSKPLYQPFYTFLILDIFTIVTILICVIGCICGLGAGFAVYKWIQPKNIDYNQINVENYEV